MAHDMSASLGHRALQCRRTIRQQRRCRNFVSHHPEFRSNVTQSQSFGSAKWVFKKTSKSAILKFCSQRSPNPVSSSKTTSNKAPGKAEIEKFLDLLSDDLTFGVQEMWRVSEWMNHDSMTTVVGQLNNPLRLGCTHCEALPTMSQFVPKISGQSWRDVKIMGKLKWHSCVWDKFWKNSTVSMKTEDTSTRKFKMLTISRRLQLPRPGSLSNLQVLL